MIKCMFLSEGSRYIAISIISIKDIQINIRNQEARWQRWGWRGRQESGKAKPKQTKYYIWAVWVPCTFMISETKPWCLSWAAEGRSSKYLQVPPCPLFIGNHSWFTGSTLSPPAHKSVSLRGEGSSSIKWSRHACSGTQGLVDEVTSSLYRKSWMSMGFTPWETFPLLWIWTPGTFPIPKCMDLLPPPKFTTTPRLP